MEEIDNLPKPIRELIHEEGYTIVNAFLACGVKNHKHIRHLINTVRDGSYNGGINPLARARTGIDKN